MKLNSFPVILGTLVFNFLTANGQPPTGTLKIFSENPVVVYVDETHYPQYGDIKLVPGTHWVKAINSEGIRIFSQIVTVKAGEVTSVLIEAPKAPGPAAQNNASQTSPKQSQTGHTPSEQTMATYGQPASPSNNSQMTDNASEPPDMPRQTIDIGQTGGKLPRDMSGAFGLVFGMNIRDVDQIMTPKAVQVQRNEGFNVYAIPYESSVYVVECRFIESKLFQIIVGYVSTNYNDSKLKSDKTEVPIPEFNRMLNDIKSIFGEPDSTEKIFLGGYTEDDGRILEALKRKKALIYHTWTDEKTGNNIIVGLGYTTAPLAATVYTSGPMSADAAAGKLKIHSYDYRKSFKDNYFSN